MSRRIPIRTKLTLSLAVPLLAVGGLAWSRVEAAQADTRAVRADADLALGIIGPGSLIRTVLDEKLDAITSVVGLRDSGPVRTASFEASRRATDRALDTFRDGLADGHLAGAEVYQPILADLEEQLAAGRARFASVEPPFSLDNVGLAREITAHYDPVIEALADANTKLLNEVEEPALREPVGMMSQVVLSRSHYTTLGQWAVFAEITGTADGGPNRDLVVAAMEQTRRARRDLATYVGPSELGQVAARIMTTAETQEMRALVQGQLEGKPFDVARYLELGDQADLNAGDTLRSTTEASLRRTADRLVDEAEATERRYLLGGAAVIAAAFLASLLAGWSITRPLRSLTRQARVLATTKLPLAVQELRDTPLGDDLVRPTVAPVAVRSRDEVQDVAAALNAVQTAALDLALEQAAMRHHIADTFVSLGRRTQNLINRQLEVITELERDETDPKALQSLFGLDHLATRARRNAESLVVLGGVDPPRTYAAPIPLRDVLLGCRGEVERFDRVEVVVIDDVGVPGGIAADLVHLLAELVENGLTASPPDRPVEVVGHRSPRGYVVTVVDQGIGMDEAELAAANAGLARTEDFTIAPSRHLGLHVVAQLAHRLGARVVLQEAFTGGVAARVTLPLDRLIGLEDGTSSPTVAAATAGATTVGAGSAPDGGATGHPRRGDR